MKFLLLNGPNLNLLGTRQPDIYGTTTLEQVEDLCSTYAAEHKVELSCFQSNHEGVLIDVIQEARNLYDGIVYNPGAHTHYSYAIRDAIASIDTPVVEVHLSDIAHREGFRARSVLFDECIGQVSGLGPQSYLRGIDMLLEHLS